jgi:NTP pyrophosphatase (non-canonical NTP hydrolase)
MTTREYETRIEEMDFYRAASDGPDYHKAEIGPLASYALGVTGEAGEVAEKVKKFYRDGTVTERDIALELGDVCWYVTRLANLLGYSLQDILALNIEKLEARRARGTQRGSGDNR